MLSQTEESGLASNVNEKVLSEIIMAEHNRRMQELEEKLVSKLKEYEEERNEMRTVIQGKHEDNAKLSAQIR